MMSNDSMISRYEEQQQHEHVDHVSYGGESNGFSELLMNCSVWAAGLDCYQTKCDPASATLAE